MRSLHAKSAVNCNWYLCHQGFISSLGNSLLDPVNNALPFCCCSFLIQHVQHFDLLKTKCRKT